MRACFFGLALEIEVENIVLEKYAVKKIEQYNGTF